MTVHPDTFADTVRRADEAAAHVAQLVNLRNMWARSCLDGDIAAGSPHPTRAELALLAGMTPNHLSWLARQERAADAPVIEFSLHGFQDVLTQLTIARSRHVRWVAQRKQETWLLRNDGIGAAEAARLTDMPFQRFARWWREARGDHVYEEHPDE